MNLEMLPANSPFHPAGIAMTDEDLAEQLRLDDEEETEETAEVEGEMVDDEIAEEDEGEEETEA